MLIALQTEYYGLHKDHGLIGTLINFLYQFYINQGAKHNNWNATTKHETETVSKVCSDLTKRTD